MPDWDPFPECQGAARRHLYTEPCSCASDGRALPTAGTGSTGEGATYSTGLASNCRLRPSCLLLAMHLVVSLPHSAFVH